ncbi:glycosyltransferase family 2 protein [Dyadobacter frigoris]|uniref:Glycosyltransferase family 2 protein n=1 Tax=Dyadobacter frigoris TaxID=2576211 RepID=A0A4V6BHR5_9BACT|nr:glycosyltransferase family 2 protein [Dyadobacter frigoris]TKT87393.1 glycosyltransferase family 2 protein [Dyadobacter frigoris]GLU55611.1 polyprenol phosphate mannosyl transferase 1 [Dyadobacter frigoris]
MKLSIVIPAYNEEESISIAVKTLYHVLTRNKIEHEIWVTDDNSKDNTAEVLKNLKLEIPTLVYETNYGPNGFGFAIRYGLERYSGDCVAIFMADLSDDPDDLVRYYKMMMETGVDAVFGSRWIKGGRTIDYPFKKKIINRIANNIIKLIIGVDYDDATNAFKLYKRKTIDGVKPFLSPHFNLTIELSLKTIVRGYTYVIIPNSWTNRTFGVSNLKIREMGSRYFFILMYCFLEKYFSKGDFKKKW